MRRKVNDNFFHDLKETFLKHGVTYMLVHDEQTNCLNILTNLELGHEHDENESEYYVSQDCHVKRFMKM